MCIKRVFSAKYHVFTHLTLFLVKKTAMKHREMLVLALVSLILHNSMRLLVSQCFHCVKTDNVQKTRFSAFNLVFAGKCIQTQENT